MGEKRRPARVETQLTRRRSDGDGKAPNHTHDSGKKQQWMLKRWVEV